MKTIKTVTTILLAASLGLSICACKRQEAPYVMSDDDAKDMCIAAGNDFFNYFSALNYSAISDLSLSDVGSHYLADANQYHSLITDDTYGDRRLSTGWMKPTLEELFANYNYLSGVFERTSDTSATMSYIFVTSQYSDGLPGSYYDVELEFTIDNEEDTIYLDNPEITLDLYRAMISDYSIHQIDSTYTNALREAAALAGETEDPMETYVYQEVVVAPESLPEAVPGDEIIEPIQPENPEEATEI